MSLVAADDLNTWEIALLSTSISVFAITCGCALYYFRMAYIRKTTPTSTAATKQVVNSKTSKQGRGVKATSDETLIGESMSTLKNIISGEVSAAYNTVYASVKSLVGHVVDDFTVVEVAAATHLAATANAAARNASNTLKKAREDVKNLETAALQKEKEAMQKVVDKTTIKVSSTLAPQRESVSSLPPKTQVTSAPKTQVTSAPALVSPPPSVAAATVTVNAATVAAKNSTAAALSAMKSALQGQKDEALAYSAIAKSTAQIALDQSQNLMPPKEWRKDRHAYNGHKVPKHINYWVVADPTSPGMTMQDQTNNMIRNWQVDFDERKQSVAAPAASAIKAQSVSARERERGKSGNGRGGRL